MGHEHGASITQTSEETVDMTIDLGNLDVGVAVLYGERVRKIQNSVPKVANLVPLHGQHSMSQSAMRSPGNHSWVNSISVIISVPMFNQAIPNSPIPLILVKVQKLDGWQKRHSQNRYVKVKNSGVNIYTYEYRQQDVWGTKTLRGEPSS